MKNHYPDVTNNMCLALTDFCYNCGYSNLLKITNNFERTLVEIGNKLPEYCKSKGIVLKGLQVRREFEKELFFDNYLPKVEEPHYTEKNIQVLCNKIIRDFSDKYSELKPLSEDGIIGQKSLDTIFTLLYLGHGYY